MRWFVLTIGLALSLTVTAQEPAKKKTKPAAKKTAHTSVKAHQKPTPEQIRKFNELQKKQK